MEQGGADADWGVLQKHHVTVLSDEIHCDLTEPGYEYVPFAAACEICREISITCISATKTFHLAGLQTAAIFTPNEGIRNIMLMCRKVTQQFDRQLSTIPFKKNFELSMHL